MTTPAFGPTETITRSCDGCAACVVNLYAVQGDSGYTVQCAHPALNEARAIGDSTWRTPSWCPAPRVNATAGGVTEDAKNAARYRWLRDTLHGAKAGGGVEVNRELQVYEQPTPGEEVRVFWYPSTPVGFCEHTAKTLDEAIDAALRAAQPETSGGAG